MMDKDLESEVMRKDVLHWNCRGFGTLPEELKSESNKVRELYFKWNNLSKLPDWLGILQKMTNLYLQHNHVRNIPETIGNMRSLSVLNISHNCLDALPPEIGRLNHLTDLIAAYNNLTDVPQEFRTLQALERLDLSGNMLGHLSVSVFECQALQELLLDNNRIASLPDSIVYLPSLATLSLRGNQLLYLPHLPFVSSPYICFDDNPCLNYISLVLGCQVTACKDNINICNGLWDLKTHGCFQNSTIRENFVNQVVAVQQGESFQNMSYLVLPKALQHMTSATHSCDLVPTLREIALRAVYCMGYHQSLQINIYCGTIFAGMSRIQNNVNLFASLPIQLQYQIRNGPVTLCHLKSCQQPIFTFAILWIIPMSCISENRDDVDSVLSTVLFCSLNCSKLYQQWERHEGLKENNLHERKLNWYAIKKVKF